MNKILLTIAAAFLFNSTMVQAEVKTFNLTFSGADYGNNLRATGSMTFDTINYVLSGGSWGVDSANISDLRITVTGSDIAANNRTYTKSNDFNYIQGRSPYEDILFNSSRSLDFSRELVGQTLSDGSQWGFTTPGGANYFTLISSSAFNGGASTLAGRFSYGVMGLMGGASPLDLISFSAVNPVPEADTSTMLLMGAGVMGFIARRRKQTAA